MRLGGDALVEITGLRNPCRQLDEHRAGLQKTVLGRRDDGSLVRRAGVMAVVLTDGSVRPGDNVEIALPDGPPRALEPV